jgi:outer membrane lipoprotein-sorting protein
MNRCLFAAAALAVSSCSLADDVIQTHMYRNQSKLQSYRGTLVERGVLDEGEMRSEIAYSRPDKFASRVKSPDGYAGVSLVMSGDSLVLFYPQSDYAVRIDHFPVPSESERKVLFDAAYASSQNLYDAAFTKADRTAGYSTLGFKYTAKGKSTPVRVATYSTYDRFSIPLAGEIHFADNHEYAFHYETVEFDKTIDPKVFSLDVPPNAIVSRWDLAGPNVSLEDARKQSNFDLEPPQTPPPSFHLDRTVRIDGAIPAFCFIYRDGPKMFLVFESRDYGARPVSLEHGIPVAVGKAQGRLVLSPTWVSLTFSRRGVVHYVLANVPFEGVLRTAATIPDRAVATTTK